MFRHNKQEGQHTCNNNSNSLFKRRHLASLKLLPDCISILHYFRLHNIIVLLYLLLWRFYYFAFPNIINNQLLLQIHSIMKIVTTTITTATTIFFLAATGLPVARAQPSLMTFLPWDCSWTLQIWLICNWFWERQNSPNCRQPALLHKLKWVAWREWSLSPWEKNCRPTRIEAVSVGTWLDGVCSAVLVRCRCNDDRTAVSLWRESDLPSC